MVDLGVCKQVASAETVVTMGLAFPLAQAGGPDGLVAPQSRRLMAMAGRCAPVKATASIIADG